MTDIPPVIVAGMHRSGTSLVAQLLYRCGMHMGQESALSGDVSLDNPEGYWELSPLIDLSDSLLRALDGSWDNPPQALNSDSWPDQLNWEMQSARALSVLDPLIRSGEPWGWKDPRNSILIAFWKKLFPEAKVIICLRNPIEVAFSLAARVDYRAEFADALDLWLEYYRMLGDSLDLSECLVTHFASYFYSPKQELTRLCEFANLKPTEAQITQAASHIVKALYRVQAPETLARRLVEPPAGLFSVYHELLTDAGEVYDQMASDVDYQEEAYGRALSKLFVTAAAKFSEHAERNQQLAIWLEGAKAELNLRKRYSSTFDQEDEPSVRVPSRNKSEMAQLKLDIDETRGQLAELRTRYGELDHRLGTTMERLERSQAKLGYAAARLEQQRAELERAYDGQAALENELRTMRASRGWRMLERARWLRRAIFRTKIPSGTTEIKTRLKTAIRSDIHASLRRIDEVATKLSPLRLQIEATDPRVNILIPTIDFDYVFGGYITVFNLAVALRKAGLPVRLVIVDRCDMQIDEWRKSVKEFEGLEQLFDLVAVSYHHDRSNELIVSQGDAFLAISAWTAYLAHWASTQLGRARFVYLTQEYEPLFHEAGTLYSIVNGSYDLPHHAIFSTDLYRDYARQNRIGVFRSDDGDASSVAIRNAVPRSNASRERLANRRMRKMLIYARPEAHAKRNMLELAIMGLREAIKSKTISADAWEVHGIGTIHYGGESIPLGAGLELRLKERRSLRDYLEMLPEYDIGLSLMASPHPSLPPLDMAAAGMLVVTNTFANKTADRLRGISTNIIPVEPTAADIARGLTEARDRISDIEARLRGTDLKWARTWAETFSPEVLDRVISFLGVAQPTADPGLSR